MNRWWLAYSFVITHHSSHLPASSACCLIWGAPCVQTPPVDRRWLAFGSFGTSRLFMTTDGQRVVQRWLILGEPCAQSPVDRRWLASISFGTSRLFMTTDGQRLVRHLLIWGAPCVQSPVDRRWLASISFGTSRLLLTTDGHRVVRHLLILGDPCAQSPWTDDGLPLDHSGRAVCP